MMWVDGADYEVPVREGLHDLTHWLAARHYRRILIVVDTALTNSSALRLINESADWAATGGCEAVLIGSDGAQGHSDEIAAIGALSNQVSTADCVVALGGGSVLDRIKLARVAAHHPMLLDEICELGRSGFGSMSAIPAPPTDLVAVPSTIGTGSEVSRVACVQLDARKRLIVGAALRPTLAVHDPAVTATLPRELIAEGCLEILSRIWGLVAGSSTAVPTADAVVTALAKRVMILGTACADRTLTPAGMAELASISAATHSTMLMGVYNPFASKVWYLSNELSVQFGIRKMTAIATLMPAWWRAILADDERWGSATRLRTLWSEMYQAGLTQDNDPVKGLTTLIERWGIERVRVPDRDTAGLAESICRAWGNGLPALGALTREDISTVLRSSNVPGC